MAGPRLLVVTVDVQEMGLVVEGLLPWTFIRRPRRTVATIISMDVQGRPSCDRGRSRNGLGSRGLVAVDVHSTSTSDMRGRGEGRGVYVARPSTSYLRDRGPTKHRTFPAAACRL